MLCIDQLVRRRISLVAVPLCWPGGMASLPTFSALRSIYNLVLVDAPGSFNRTGRFSLILDRQRDPP